MARASKQYEARYTQPQLRERLKEDLKASEKGGAPGKWSARKSQMLVKAYEKAGGGYKPEANREEATSLHTWTERDWRTKQGKAEARDDHTLHRYLPRKVWQALTPTERAQAERSKREAERRGDARAAWPAAVRREMRALERAQNPATQQTKAQLYLRAKQLGIRGRSRMRKEALQRAIHQAESKRED